MYLLIIYIEFKFIYIQIIKSQVAYHIIMNTGFTLEEYKSQREYREAKRKEYLRKFQLIRGKLSLNIKSQESRPKDSQQSSPVPQKRQRPESQAVKRQQNLIKQSDIDSEEASLLKQNESLRAQLAVSQEQERSKLGNFKNEITNIKEKYMSEIRQLHESAKSNKTNYETKLTKIQGQISNASKKNDQIQIVNSQLKTDIEQSQQMIDKYAQQIKKQYAAKLEEFQKIFSASNQKIEAMEKEFNEDEFIETTLKNEELMKSIQESCQKAEQTDNLLKDYQALLEGKGQILAEIGKNNEMKENQILKMSQLQGKLRAIFDKLNEEKKVYMTENSRMAEQLMQVKALLMGGINAQSSQNAEEEQK